MLGSVFRWLSNAIRQPFFGRQTQLRNERDEWTEREFVGHFADHPEVAAAVWQALRGHSVIEDFRPAPEDNLVWVFGLADEDLDDVALALLQTCGCRVPEPAETAEMPPVRTVADLVDFIGRMRGPAEQQTTL